MKRPVSYFPRAQPDYRELDARLIHIPFGGVGQGQVSFPVGETGDGAVYGSARYGVDSYSAGRAGYYSPEVYGTSLYGDKTLYAEGFGISVTNQAVYGGAVFSDVLGTGYREVTRRITDADSPYSVVSNDLVIFCDTDGGAITVNLPAGVEGTHLKIINCGSGSNNVTVDADGSEAVYGGATKTVSDGSALDLHYNSVEGWW